MKACETKIEKAKRLANMNNRSFRKIGRVYETADRYDGCDAYRNKNIDKIIDWEKGYKK